MLYPRSVTGYTALFHNGIVTLSSEVGKPIGKCDCKRVVCAGGHFFDAPLSAPLRIPQVVRVSRLRPGMTLHAPAIQPPPQPAKIRYVYKASNNAGREITRRGFFYPTELEAELLGWLVGDGTIHSRKQSIRFANSDVWVLQHVKDLVNRCFPSIKVSTYAKNVGFDIVMTGGINNPLRAFVRKNAFVSEWPTAVCRYGLPERIAFLRGLWGADGWCSVRKGGNDVVMGLSRSANDGYTSQCRLFHAIMGMNGQRRETPTETYPNKHRLVFSGYRNYTTFYQQVGQLRTQHLSAPPVRRLKRVPPSMRVQGMQATEARIVKVLRLPGKHLCYEVPDA